MESSNTRTASVPHMVCSQAAGGQTREHGLPPDKARKERRLRKALIFMGALVLAYIYSDSLLAQQSSAQRVSIGKAADFPNDI